MDFAVSNKSQSQEVNEMGTECLKKALEDLKSVAEALSKGLAKEPAEEQVEELQKMGDSKLAADIAKISRAALEKIQTVAQALEAKLSEQPLITPEALATLKTQADEGKKATQALAEIQAKEILATRLKELSEAGLRLGTEQAEAQSTSVKTMSDEQFVAYKTEMASLKSMFETMEKEKTEKAQEAEKAKVEAEALAVAKAKEEEEKVAAKADLSKDKTGEKIVAAANTEQHIETNLRSVYARL